MKNIVKQLTKLKGIEYKSKDQLLKSIENVLQDIHLNDYSINYNFISLEVDNFNKVNIIFDINNYKIIKLEITITKNIIF